MSTNIECAVCGSASCVDGCCAACTATGGCTHTPAPERCPDPGGCERVAGHSGLHMVRCYNCRSGQHDGITWAALRAAGGQEKPNGALAFEDIACAACGAVGEFHHIPAASVGGHAEIEAALDTKGLPHSVGLAGLIHQERTDAALAATFDAMRAGLVGGQAEPSDGYVPKIGDEVDVHDLAFKESAIIAAISTEPDGATWVEFTDGSGCALRRYRLAPAAAVSGEQAQPDGER